MDMTIPLAGIAACLIAVAIVVAGEAWTRWRHRPRCHKCGAQATIYAEGKYWCKTHLWNREEKNGDAQD